MLQKRASQLFLAGWELFIIMLARVSVSARIVMGVRGLCLLWDLSISCLLKFVMMIRRSLVSEQGIYDGIDWFNYFKDAYCF